jgi:proline iminopeptidase
MPRESHIPVGNAELYSRELGQGTEIIVLHGGPDFDHSYFVPDLDRLCDSFHLIYYDQRGRGRSADRVQPEDVTLASEIADIEGSTIFSPRLRGIAGTLLGYCACP